MSQPVHHQKVARSQMMNVAAGTSTGSTHGVRRTGPDRRSESKGRNDKGRRKNVHFEDPPKSQPPKRHLSPEEGDDARLKRLRVNPAYTAKELSSLVKKQSSFVDVAKLSMIVAEIEGKEQARVERLAARAQKIDAEKDEASVKILNDELLADEGNLNLESAFCCKRMHKGNEGMYKQYWLYSRKKHHKLRELFLRRVLAKFMALAEAGGFLGIVDGCFTAAAELQC